jgi:hypothetical protein
MNQTVRKLPISALTFRHYLARTVARKRASSRDFPGRYFALSTGVALVRGESGAVLKNEHGVTMQLATK